MNFTSNTSYAAFSFIPSIAPRLFRLVKSKAKLIMYVDTQTMQKSPRTKARIDARYSEPATDTQEEKTKNTAAFLDSDNPAKETENSVQQQQRSEIMKRNYSNLCS